MTDNSPHKNASGFQRIVKAFLYSVDGLKSAIAVEQAFRQELLLAAILIPVAFALPVSLTQSAILVMSIMVVLIAELVNSAIEAAIDRISLEKHPLAKRAKDVGSAAVLLALLNGGVVWLLILWDAFGA
ncbi:MAG: diacylglycerol kinase [Pseudomonadota bacterium]